MNDVSAESAKDRFWIVISWIQFGLILLVLSSATIIAGHIAGLSRGRMDDIEPSLIFGLIGLATLAVSSYIFTGRLRFRPQTHTTLQVVVIVVAVFLSAASFYAEFSRSRENTDSSTETKTKDDDRDYTLEFLQSAGEEWALLTHKTTSRKLIYQTYKDSNNLSSVAAMVVNDTLVADARWEVECLPNSALTESITCRGDGKSAHALYIVKPVNWKDETFSRADSPLRWRLLEGGFSVVVDFHRWPLDTLRQQDAIFRANGKDQPDLTEVTSISEIFRH